MTCWYKVDEQKKEKLVWFPTNWIQLWTEPGSPKRLKLTLDRLPKELNSQLIWQSKDDRLSKSLAKINGHFLSFSIRDARTRLFKRFALLFRQMVKSTRKCLALLKIYLLIQMFKWMVDYFPCFVFLPEGLLGKCVTCEESRWQYAFHYGCNIKSNIRIPLNFIILTI